MASRTEPRGQAKATRGWSRQPGGTRPARPPLPGGTRSPFEEPLDTDKPARPETRAEARRRCRRRRAILSSWTNPMPAAPRPGQARPPAPGAASNGPELSAPADQPARSRELARARTKPPTSRMTAKTTGPMLALPKVNLPPVDDPGVPFGTQPPAPAADVASNANATPPADTLERPRRGFLSGLFSNLGLNWTRR